MIKGFENETQPLTGTEMVIMEIIVQGFNKGKHVGKSNAVTNDNICKGVNDAIKNGRLELEDRAFKLTSVRLRKIIHHIRVNNLVPLLCSNSKGYYLALSSEEVREYLAGLKVRIDSIIAINVALTKQYFEKYEQQNLNL